MKILIFFCLLIINFHCLGQESLSYDPTGYQVNPGVNIQKFTNKAIKNAIKVQKINSIAKKEGPLKELITDRTLRNSTNGMVITTWENTSESYFNSCSIHLPIKFFNSKTF